LPWSKDIVPGSSRVSESWKLSNPLDIRLPSLQGREAR
jgi:hypothetical protein